MKHMLHETQTVCPLKWHRPVLRTELLAQIPNLHWFRDIARLDKMIESEEWEKE